MTALIELWLIYEFYTLKQPRLQLVATQGSAPRMRKPVVSLFWVRSVTRNKLT